MKKATIEWKKIKELKKREAAVEFLCAALYIHDFSRILKTKFFNLQCKNKTTKNIQFLRRQNNADGLLLVAGFFFVNVYLCFLFLYVLLSTQT